MRVGKQRIVVVAPGARAVIDRSPFRLTIRNQRGRSVLGEVSGRGAKTLNVPTAVRNVSGLGGPLAPPRGALYAPLTFLVGAQEVSQTPASIFAGNLAAVKEGGVEYAARAVTSVRRVPGGVRLVLSTSDPSGRSFGSPSAGGRGRARCGYRRGPRPPPA